MKRIWILLMAWACMVNTALADDVIYVDDVNLPLTGGGNLVVKFSFSEANSCSGFSFDVVLPEGVEFMKTNSGAAILTNGDCYAEDGAPSFQSNFDSNNDHTLRIGCFTANGTPIISKTGVLVSIKIKASAGQTVDNVLTGGNIVNVKKSNKDGSVSTTLSDSQFNIKIVDWIELDENSLTVPDKTTGNKEIHVKRTIKAGVWSTLCLPFNMTEDQVIYIFGEGTKLAEFHDYSVSNEGNDVTAISVSFKETEEEEGVYFWANYPYIIKATKNVTDFSIYTSIDDVNLQDAVSSSTYKSGKSTYPKGKFTGTYVAQTIIPANKLFLNDNKFFYSTGATKMKAFRAYFDFIDVLTDANSANARVMMSIGGETTKIDARTMEPIETGKVYNMAGQYVGEAENTDNLAKGIYIVNGKKKVIK